MPKTSQTYLSLMAGMKQKESLFNSVTDEWNFMTNGNMIDISNIPYSVARNSIGEKSVKVDIEISTFVCSEKLVTCFLRWLAFMLHGFHVSIKEASHHDLCFF